MRFLVVLTTVACLSHLHNAEYTILSSLTLQRQLRQTIDNPSFCKDQAICATTPDICTSGDRDILNSVCPVKCGGCVCEDNASTGGTCGSLVPDICTEDLGLSLCPKSCGFCGAPTTAAPDCEDQVIGISCSDLPDPCNDDLGKVACKKFCNFCPTVAPPTTVPVTVTDPPTTPKPVATTVKDPATTAASASSASPASGPCATSPCLNGGTCQATSSNTYQCLCPNTHSGVVCHIAGPSTTVAPPTTQPPTAVTASGTCPDLKTTKNNLGCIQADIIFMIEYSVSDSSWFSVDHEGDFIKAVVEEWRLDDSHIRVGVIVYHDTVREGIHLGDYSSYTNFRDKVSSLTRRLRPSGNADLGKALDYARENSFKDARPGAEKILVPIIHQTESPEKERIGPAAERLKNSCIGLYGIAVQGSTLDTDVVKAAVSKPTDDYYQSYNSYSELEYIAKNYYNPQC